jgi:hypothetical protein
MLCGPSFARFVSKGLGAHSAFEIHSCHKHSVHRIFCKLIFRVEADGSACTVFSLSCCFRRPLNHAGFTTELCCKTSMVRNSLVSGTSKTIIRPRWVHSRISCKTSMVRNSLVSESSKTGSQFPGVEIISSHHRTTSGLHPISVVKQTRFAIPWRRTVFVKQAWFASPWCQNQLKQSLDHVRVYSRTLL